MLTCARCDYDLKDVIEIILVDGREFRYALCFGKYESTLFFSEINDYAFVHDMKWEYPRWLHQS